jgi:uncharacterized protein YjiS (DUF1127 family)
MRKLLNAWREQNWKRRDKKQPAQFDEQLLADLGLTWHEVTEAKTQQSRSYVEAAVFP